jgi:hypothetical protein
MQPSIEFAYNQLFLKESRGRSSREGLGEMNRLAILSCKDSHMGSSKTVSWLEVFGNTAEAHAQFLRVSFRFVLRPFSFGLEGKCDSQVVAREPIMVRGRNAADRLISTLFYVIAANSRFQWLLACCNPRISTVHSECIEDFRSFVRSGHGSSYRCSEPIIGLRDCVCTIVRIYHMSDCARFTVTRLLCPLRFRRVRASPTTRLVWMNSSSSSITRAPNFFIHLSMLRKASGQWREYWFRIG